MHISYTLTHTYMDTDAQGLIQLYMHQNTFIPSYTSLNQHPRIHLHTCIHALILAHTCKYIQTHIHTLALTYKHLHTCAREC